MIKLRFSPRFSGSFRKNAAGNEEKEIPLWPCCLPIDLQAFPARARFSCGLAFPAPWARAGSPANAFPPFFKKRDLF